MIVAPLPLTPPTRGGEKKGRLPISGFRFGGLRLGFQAKIISWELAADS